MFGEVVAVLKNWKVCGFIHPMEINFDDSMPKHKYIVAHYNRYDYSGSLSDVTYHTTLLAAKQYVRKEYAAPHSINFKWVKPTTGNKQHE